MLNGNFSFAFLSSDFFPGAFFSSVILILIREIYKQKYNKEYSPVEEAVRKSFFYESVARAQKRNEINIAAGGQAIFGITKFSDRSQGEKN